MIPRSSATLAIVLGSLFIGCEKVPTFQEITGQEAAPKTPVVVAPPVIQKDAAVVPAPVQPPPVVDDPAIVMAILTRSAGATLTDQDIARATKLPSILEELKTLNISGSAVTDAGIRMLSPFTALTQLNLASLRINGAGLDGLQPLDNLREMSMVSLQMESSAGWEHLGKLTQVETLNLTLTNITDAEIPVLLKMTGLKDLNIGSTSITDAGLAQLVVMENLQILRMEGTRKINGTGLKAFAQSKQKTALRCLYAANTLLSREGMSNVKRIASLEVFDNSLTGLNDQLFFELKGATNLKTLAVGSNNLSAASGPTIQSMRNLENLDLRQNPVGSQVLTAIAKLTDLRTLNLTKTGCTPANVQDFRRLRKNCEVTFEQ